MSILVTFASLFIISILVKVILKKKNQRLYELLEQFPSHSTYPLIGNIHLLLNFKSFLAKLEEFMQYVDRRVFWFGPIPIVFLKKYEDIAIILSQCTDREMFGLIDDWLGKGIINASSKSNEWKIHRRLLVQVFASEMFSKYLKVFNKNASILVERLKSVADTGKEINILDWMRNVSLDSVVENMTGISIENREQREPDYSYAYNELFTSTEKRFRYPWLYLNFVNKFYLKITKKTRIIEQLRLLSTQILEKKLNKYSQFQRQKDTIDDANSSRNAIDILIKKSLEDPDFTETSIRDELSHLFVTGVETTAMNLTFLLLMLAMNQEIQQKVYEEIKQLPTSRNNFDGELSEDDLNNNLGYLEQCIRETLRFFTPSSITIRRTHKEILLGDKTIPANVLVLISFHLANKDPELYKNPLKWDPEHFSDEAIKQRPITSQLSFGYGPRNCIGSKYSMISIKTKTTHILRRYHLSTNLQEVKNKDLYMDLAIRNQMGYPVKFTSRQEARA